MQSPDIAKDEGTRLRRAEPVPKAPIRLPQGVFWTSAKDRTSPLARIENESTISDPSITDTSSWIIDDTSFICIMTNDVYLNEMHAYCLFVMPIGGGTNWGARWRNMV